MNNYYKYLPVSKEDENWGLTVLNSGCTHIGPSNNYPSKGHPKHHNFDWRKGRILSEFQIIYITNGEGIFESRSQKAKIVNAGTVILLFPDEWHKYKPDEKTGWNEYWIGLKGPIIDNLLSSGYIRPENACVYIGFHHEILNIFNEIIEQTKLEKTGYQPQISGAALSLLGMIHAISKQNSLNNFETDDIISRAQLLFRANIKNMYGPEQAAEELKVGYSWFRKQFKSYTGLSPGQYYLQLKIELAKTQLLTSNCSVKNVAYNMNFESVGYFSKIFKEKTGHKPTEFRKLFQQGNWEQ